MRHSSERFRPGAGTALLLTGILLAVCGGSDAASHRAGTPDGACWVQLFDGDRYADDSVFIAGPGEFPALDALPGTDKNWDDEADSFQSGEDATVTFWPERNFQGKPVVHERGAREPAIDEPGSLKIACP